MKVIDNPHHQRGAVAIEFALIFPLFLVVLYGMISYSIYFVALHDLNRLSGEAARSAVALERQEDGLPDSGAIAGLVDTLIGERALFASLIARCDDGDFFPSGNRELEVCLRLEAAAFLLPAITLGEVTVPDVDNATIRSRVTL